MTSDMPADLAVSDPGRDSHPGSRRSRGLVGAAVIAGVGIAGITVACLWSPAGASSGPEICPFRLMTGLPCPGCGLTRSWVNLMHGHVSRAFTFNLFGPVFLVATAGAVLLALWSLFTRSTAPFDRLRTSRSTQVLIAVAAVWIAYGVFRTIDDAAGWGIFPIVS